MKIREEIVNKALPSTFSFDSFAGSDWSNYLFFDIETLGFHRRSHPVVMIGAIQIKGPALAVSQWISDSIEDEPAMLKSFFQQITANTVLLSFNGLRFDWPFLSARAKKYRILPPVFKNHIDLYQFYRGGFAYLNVNTHTLRELTKTNFQFFSVESKEIPALLRTYLSGKKRNQILGQLYAHNEEDLLGLLALEEIMAAIQNKWQICTAQGDLVLRSIHAAEDYYIIRYQPSNQTLATLLMTQGKNWSIDWIQDENQVEFKFRYLEADHQNRRLHLLPAPWMSFPLPQASLPSLNLPESNQLRVLKSGDDLDHLLLHEICRSMAKSMF
jgi:hypothetical protein